MAKRGLRSNPQLIAAIILVVVVAAGWIGVRRYEAGLIAGGDASACWTATCRDAVLQANHERTTNAYAAPAQPTE